MISWLNENRVSHREDLHKPDLYELIRTYKPMYHTCKIGFWKKRVIQSCGYHFITKNWILIKYWQLLKIGLLIRMFCSAWKIWSNSCTRNSLQLAKMTGCNHMIATEPQYVTTEAFLDRSGNCCTSGKWEFWQYAWRWSCEHSAGLYSTSWVASLNMNSDTNQLCLKYSDAVNVSCSGVIILHYRATEVWSHFLWVPNVVER
jgi:hypothetical protein